MGTNDPHSQNPAKPLAANADPATDSVRLGSSEITVAVRR